MEVKRLRVMPQLFRAPSSCWHGAALGAATLIGTAMEKHKNIRTRPAKTEHVLNDARAWHDVTWMMQERDSQVQGGFVLGRYQEHRETLGDIWDHACMHFESIQQNVQAIQHVGFRGLLAQNTGFACVPNLRQAMLYEFANLLHELQAPSWLNSTLSPYT